MEIRLYVEHMRSKSVPTIICELKSNGGPAIFLSKLNFFCYLLCIGYTCTHTHVLVFTEILNICPGAILPPPGDMWQYLETLLVVTHENWC